jgi:hypothetical protein
MNKLNLLQDVAGLVRNVVYTRAAWLHSLLDSQHRNIEHECGHPTEVSLEDYDWMYQRGDIASRVVSILPEETWSQDPEVYETEDPDLTEFEAAWNELNRRLSLWAHLQRVDTLSGIGRFGILLLGFDDGADLASPIAPGKNRRLLYLRPLDELVLKIRTLDINLASPRYGLPELYEITFLNTQSGDLMGVQTGSRQTVQVHWSRVIHVADNRTNSEIFGIPRMKRVFNRLLDIKKIAGGSGEMFWKGGFPGISLETQPQMGPDVEFDKEATQEEMEDYMNGLKRYIATIGMNVKSLSVDIADPRPHLEVHLRLIATCLGVPWRVFVGSESAHLASSQDEQTWNRRLTQRRRNYINPYLIRPFVDRLIEMGVLPVPTESYNIYWPDLNTPSEEQRAQNAERQSNALAKYVQTGANLLLPPFFYLTEVMGFEAAEAEAILAAAEDEEPLLPEPTPASAPPKAGAGVRARSSGNPANNATR